MPIKNRIMEARRAAARMARAEAIEVFEQAGRSLHGERFGRAFAADLEVDPTQIKRWRDPDGSMRPGHPIYDRIEEVLSARINMLTAARNRVRALTEEGLEAAHHD